MSDYTTKEKKILLAVADDSIKYGLDNHCQIKINIEDYPEKLRQIGACFVTLEVDGELRGCMGSLIAHQPLIADIAHNAYCAAFSDPRFIPLTADELPHLVKHISILSKPEPMQFKSEQDLLSQLRPGVDGLILSDFGYRGTFLPAVWESCPEPEMFLKHLKLKACLPEDYWSETIKVARYTTEVIE